MRICVAIAYRDMDKIGMTAYFHPYQPDTGSHFSLTASRRISISDSQKPGIETPSMPTMRAAASATELR